MKNCTNNFTCCQAQPLTMPIGYCGQIHFYGLLAIGYWLKIQTILQKVLQTVDVMSDYW